MIASRMGVGVAGVVVWVWGASLLAAEQPPPQGGAPGTPPIGVRAFGWGGQGMMMPPVGNFNLLQMEHVQKDLELNSEQLDKLKDLGRQYQEEARQDWEGFQNLTPEERQARAKANQDKMAKRVAFYRQQIERILLPHQLEEMKKINLRVRGQSLLANPFTLDRLGVTAEQKEKLIRINQEHQQKMWDLQRETFQEGFELLTAEQRKKLEEMTEPGYRWPTPAAKVEAQKK